MTEPLVSIIIPVYNAAAYLEECINSLNNQTWHNNEIIIIDDGSTDQSLTIANSYANDKIKVFTQLNKGASAARNKGLQEAKGDYIQFLDADDLLSTDKIIAQVQLLQINPDKVAVCNTIHFNDGDNHLNDQHISYKSTFLIDADPMYFLMNLWGGYGNKGAMIQPNAWLTPRHIIDEAGLWNEELTVDDDGEFFCRVLLASKGVKYSPTGLNYYRKYTHRSSLSSQKNLKDFESILKAIDLKYHYLTTRSNNIIINQIFARHYWELGVVSFPKFRTLSNLTIQKAKQLGFKGKKYHAGRISTMLSKIFGWQLIRWISYYKHGY